jgi:hypothetical protein
MHLSMKIHSCSCIRWHGIEKIRALRAEQIVSLAIVLCHCVGLSACRVVSSSVVMPSSPPTSERARLCCVASSLHVQGQEVLALLVVELPRLVPLGSAAARGAVAACTDRGSCAVVPVRGLGSRARPWAQQQENAHQPLIQMRWQLQSRPADAVHSPSLLYSTFAKV